MNRREIAAKHLHDARCPGCINGSYSGQHKPLPETAGYEQDLRRADALLAELDNAEDA